MDLFDLSAKITLDTREYERGLDQAKGKFAGFGSKLKSGLATAAKVSVAAVGAAATAVGAIVKKSIDAYAEYEQLVGGVETLFKNSAGAVQEYAANAYKTAGLSANQYMETVTSFSASLLQSLGGDTERAAQIGDMAITDMADNANKMGTAMESIQAAYQGFAKQNYTMLDNLKLGYGGTKTEMERLLADAEKFSGVHYDISNLNDVYEAIHVIQGELHISGRTAEEAAEIIARTGRSSEEVYEQLGTTAKEASTTIKGSVDSAKAAWQNLLVGLADDSQDFDALVNNFVDSVVTAGDNLLPRIEKTLDGIAKLITALAPKIVPIIVQVITDNLPLLLKAAVEIVAALAKGIIMALPQLLTAVGELMVSALQELDKKSQEWGERGREFVQQLKQGFSQKASDFTNTVSVKLDDTKARLRSKFEEMRNIAISTVVNMAISVLEKFQSIRDGIAEKIEAARSAVQNGIDRMRAALNFSWSLPRLKLPRITVTGGVAPYGIGGKGSLPRFDIQWMKKAMNEPFLFTEATLFGAGEAGDEVMYGRNNLLNDIREAVNGAGTSSMEVTINVYAQPGQNINELAEKIQDRLVALDKQRKAAFA